MLEKNTETEKPPPLGGGPLGLGDPNDLRLRKTERDIILPKMMREEATRRCKDKMQIFADCAIKHGLLVGFKCKEESRIRDECLLSFLKNPDFVNEITERYLEARSYYRQTGKPLIKHEMRRERSGFC